MIELPIFNQDGQQIDTVQVDEEKLGGSVRINLLKQALVMYHANKRQGTVRTQARGEVAGSTRKLFKQKGTGNARTGGIRNPIKVGGGHAKQKRPKEWRQALPKKARRLARNSAILSKIQSKDLRVIDKITLAEAKTKHVAKVFKALGIDRSCLLAINGRDEQLVRSARNIDRLTLTSVGQLNAWDIMKNRTLLVTREGLEMILSGETASTAAEEEVDCRNGSYAHVSHPEIPPAFVLRKDWKSRGKVVINRLGSNRPPIPPVVLLTAGQKLKIEVPMKVSLPDWRVTWEKHDGPSWTLENPKVGGKYPPPSSLLNGQHEVRLQMFGPPTSDMMSRGETAAFFFDSFRTDEGKQFFSLIWPHEGKGEVAAKTVSQFAEFVRRRFDRDATIDLMALGEESDREAVIPAARLSKEPVQLPGDCISVNADAGDVELDLELRRMDSYTPICALAWPAKLELSGSGLADLVDLIKGSHPRGLIALGDADLASLVSDCVRFASVKAG